MRKKLQSAGAGVSTVDKKSASVPGADWRTPQELVELPQAFRRAEQSAHPEGNTAQGTVRQRKAGGGRKGQRRTTEQQLRFCLG